MDFLDVSCFLERRRSIQPDFAYNELCWSQKRELTRSLGNDPQQWWMSKCEEMERETAIGNSQHLYRLIRDIGLCMPTNTSLRTLQRKTRKPLRHQLSGSPRNDHEKRCNGKRSGIEKAAAIDNGCNPRRLIRNISARKPRADKMIKGSAGTPIHSQESRLARWLEQFRRQFSWPTATVGLQFIPRSKPRVYLRY